VLNNPARRERRPARALARRRSEAMRSIVESTTTPPVCVMGGAQQGRIVQRAPSVLSVWSVDYLLMAWQ
jgi:hypothetical protein